MWLFKRAHLGFAATVACITLLAIPCLAAEAGGGGFDRSTWDVCMRIVNFGILAFVIYKYGKDPLVKFLAGKRASVVLSLEELEKETEYLARQREEQDTLLSNIDEKIGSIRDYYHRLGQDEKQKIMERATVQRDHMLEDARRRSERELEKAKGKFRAEVVEMALQSAEARIRQNITVADERELIGDYIRQLSDMSGQSSHNGSSG